jgi:hypothetical protein
MVTEAGGAGEAKRSVAVAPGCAAGPNKADAEGHRLPIYELGAGPAGGAPGGAYFFAWALAGLCRACYS